MHELTTSTNLVNVVKPTRKVNVLQRAALTTSAMPCLSGYLIAAERSSSPGVTLNVLYPTLTEESHNKPA